MINQNSTKKTKLKIIKIALTLFVGLGAIATYYNFSINGFPWDSSFIIPQGQKVIDTEPSMLPGQENGRGLPIRDSAFNKENFKSNFGISPNQFLRIYNKFLRERWDGSFIEFKDEWLMKPINTSQIANATIVMNDNVSIHCNKDELVDCVYIKGNRPFQWLYFDDKYLGPKSLDSFGFLGYLFEDICSDAQLFNKLKKSNEIIETYRREILKAHGFSGDEGPGAVQFIHRGVRVGILYDSSPNAEATFIFTPAI